MHEGARGVTKDLEKILSKRLSYKASKDFDQNFWSKFDEIKEVQDQDKFAFLSFMLPALAACLLFVFIGTQSQQSQFESEVELAQVIELAPLLEEFDVLAELDDEDWEILLGEDS